ncbi:MAG: hypothetical protein NUV75_11400 [Gallionella sp.]|nr:hypothetical protein [Gallionella sp.]
MPNALIYATQILAILPQLIAAGKNITDLVTTGNATLERMKNENREPTPEEWAELSGRIRALQAELHS